MIIYIMIGILAVLILWIVATYNFFVSSKARVKAAIQEIGNQLKRQIDLIPNLEASVKGYLTHEKGIFEMLTEARKAVAAAIRTNDPQKMADAGAKLAAVLPSLQIAVEDNPELKASDVVAKLMDELRDTADKLMYARRLVIDLTVDYNVRRVSFPSSLLASMFSFTELPGVITPESGEHVSVIEREMKTPKVSL